MKVLDLVLLYKESGVYKVILGIWLLLFFFRFINYKICLCILDYNCCVFGVF